MELIENREPISRLPFSLLIQFHSRFPFLPFLGVWVNKNEEYSRSVIYGYGRKRSCDHILLVCGLPDEE